MSSPNAEHWEQAKAVFAEALGRSGADRVQYLNSACGNDESLRAEVESLLESFDVAGSFLERPAVESAAESLVGDQLKPGTHVGHYEILAPLGEGGMAEVYLARDLVLGRRVALKILPEYLRNDRERLQRFKQEARAASTLSHPNVCVIYEVGETEDQHPFITMEYIEGETLRQRLSEGPVTLDEALEITIQIANALAAAHDAGVVHRDIKPDNVMIRRDGYVKVLDFGLAKLTEHRRGPNSSIATLMVKSSPGMVLGTAAYMSPEQARGVAVDARSDIWSLGVVLFEMASGHPPFLGETPTDLVIAIVERDQPPISEYVEDVPVELERIVRKALRKNAEERYQFVKEMAIDLKTLQKDLELDRSLSPERSAVSVKRTSSGKQRRVNTDEMSARRLTTIGEAMPSAKWLPIVGLALAALVVFGGVFALYKSFRKQGNNALVRTPFQRINVNKLTINGSALFAAISEDGKYAAYVKSESGKESLWLRQVGNAGNLEIIPPRDGHYGGILFAPDGKFIYYAYATAAEGNSGMTVYRVPTLGTGATAVKITLEEGPASISHDRTRMAYLRFDPVQKADILKVANVDGSNERIIATRKWPSKFSYDFVTRPAWTSDDQGLAMPVLTEQNGNYSISIIELRLADGHEQTVKLSPQTFEQPYHMTVLPDGSGVVLSAKAQGASFSQIWLLSRDGSARTLTNDLSDYRDADLSDDSTSLLTIQAQALSNIYTTDKSGAGATQLTAGVGRYFDLSWAPDGKILYASDASGDADIYEVAADGTGTRQLTSGMKRNYSPAVSPDNRYVVFHSNRSGNFQIWRMDRDGSNPVQLTTGNVEAHWPRFSADSKWIYYEHFEPGVQGSTWKVPSGGGTPIKMMETVGLKPIVSPDGKWLAFWQIINEPNQWARLAVLSLDSNQPIRSFDVAPTVKIQWDTQLRWTSDSKSVTYINRSSGIENLWGQSIDGGASKQLTNFTDSKIFSFDWGRDGRLLTSRGVITSDVVLITDASR